MKVKCKISAGRRRGEFKTVIDIDDRELEGLSEEEQIEVIERHFHRWFMNTVDAQWEIEDG